MARAVLRYNDDVAKLVHSFKYAGKTYCHSTFAGLKARSLPAEDLAAPEIIIPVPLHRQRLQERGFNQAAILAALFFPDAKQRICVDALSRTRRTPPQTGLRGKDRRKNLKNAFAVDRSSQVKGKAVLLVDDVFTTGTTLNECAKILKKYGAADVQALTLARVVG
jgi:ComF family protein